MLDNSLEKPITLSVRIACCASLVAFWAYGYFTLGERALTTRSFDPSTALDASIPFIGWAIWIYLFGIAWIALPAMVIFSPDLFRQTATAYALAIMLSFLCFAAIPTEATSLRNHATATGFDLLTAWLIHKLHAIDPPTNLLPSLHVSLSTAATFAIARQYRSWQAPAFYLLIAVIASVLVTKQHTITDVVGGLIVALVALGLSGRLKQG